MTSQRSSETSHVADSEQLLVRSRAIHSSKHDDSSTQCSSPISPRASPARCRKGRPAYRKAYSEASVYRRDRQEDVATIVSPSARLVSGFERRAFPTPPDPSPTDLCTSRKSSISERARRLLRISGSGKTSHATPETEIPEDTGPSLSWKREISGRWIEVRMGRKTQSPGYSRSGSTDSVLPDSAGVFEAGALQMKEGFTSVSALPVAVEPLGKDPKVSYSSRKGGLYSRARRRLGLQQGSEETTRKAARTNTSTLHVLERASSLLRVISVTKKSSPTLSKSASSQSISTLHGRPARKAALFGRSGYSSSSSIRKMKMGIQPRNSPDDEGMYTDAAGKQHLVVEMTSPDGPAYLPSEARRIGTPPLPSSSPGVWRGFFLDENTPSDSESNDRMEWSPPGAQQQKRHTDVDWYQARVAAAKAKAAQFQFELKVPEHLPSSPMCPRHPKNHLTGGRGICVYHGRNVAHAEVRAASKSDDM